MPVKAKINKSEEVRKLQASGVTSAPQIIAKLKSRGIKVAASQVYQIIARKKEKKKPKAATSAPRRQDVNGTLIDTTVLFVRQAGGMTKARDLLAKLALLRD